MKLKLPESFNLCKGVFIGGCVARGEGSSFRAKAHCHNVNKPIYPNYGWICVRSLKRIGEYVLNSDKEYDGEIIKPSNLILHEYAHLLAPNQGHTPKFFKELKSIGGHIDKADRYHAPKSIRKAKY